jgi:AcrR family transcriptional regulator
MSKQYSKVWRAIMAVGRKKTFDEDVALKAAMDVFWEKGYIGASLSELTQRMGINKPSLYSTYGNKEALFVRATKLYCDNKIGCLSDLLKNTAHPLKQRIKTYMMSIITVQCESEKAKGCYIVQCQTEVASGDIPAEASQLLNDAGLYVQALLEDLLTNDLEAKKMGLDKEAKVKAFCLASTLRGTATMCRCGHDISELEPVIEHSLKGIGLE